MKCGGEDLCHGGVARPAPWLAADARVASEPRLAGGAGRPPLLAPEPASWGGLVVPAALAGLLLSVRRSSWDFALPAAVLLVPLTLASTLFAVAFGIPQPPCPDPGTCAEDIAGVPDAVAVSMHVAAALVPGVLLGLAAGLTLATLVSRRRRLGQEG